MKGALAGADDLEEPAGVKLRFAGSAFISRAGDGLVKHR